MTAPPGWRYIAVHPVTGEVVDWEAPLSGVALTRRLSGPWGLTGALPVEYPRLYRDDGSRELDEWGVAVWAELDGVIRGGGILTGGQIIGQQWDLLCEGYLRYPYGMPYLGNYQRVNLDPIDAAREIWRYLQSFPDGDLGVIVGNTKTGGAVKVGIPARAAYFEVSFSAEGTKAADMVWVRESDVEDKSRINDPAKERLAGDIGENATSLTLKELGKFGQVEAPFTIKIGSEYIRVRERSGKVLSQLVRGWDVEKREGKPADRREHDEGDVVEYEGTPRRKVERVPAEPYQLVWWDAPDCGDEFETLAKETPFEFVEDHAWAGETIEHRVRIGYPRIGARRDDVVFVEGENLAVIPTEERDAESFGQYVVGLGAGEGRKRRRTDVIGNRDKRLRRVHVLDRPDVGSVDRLTRLATAEQRARKTIGRIPDIVVKDHPNARLGSWQLGDEVKVVLGYGWSRAELWCRIVEEAVTPETFGEAAVLKLARADGL